MPSRPPGWMGRRSPIFLAGSSERPRREPWPRSKTPTNSSNSPTHSWGTWPTPKLSKTVRTGLFPVIRNGPDAASPQRPLTSLSEAALLTNAREDPNLAHELAAELASADRVDLLCAFVKWSGLRILEKPLTELHRRGVPLRVITTTYMGAT